MRKGVKVCKIKKQLNNEELEKQNLIYINLLSEKESELEKQKNNYEILLFEKDNQLKFKNEYINSLEKKYNDLINILKNKN
jgi:hypothetical protein